jgi:hypothetical protein
VVKLVAVLSGLFEIGEDRSFEDGRSKVKRKKRKATNGDGEAKSLFCLC